METIKKNKNDFLKLTLPRIIVLVSIPLLFLSYIFKFHQVQPNVFNKIMKTLLFIKNNYYFDSVTSLSLGVIGLVLTLISIFGVGVSKAVLTMEKHNINQYLNYVLDLIILSILTAVFSVYLKHTLNLNTDFSIYFNLIYLIILSSTIISLIIIIALTFMMYAINLLSYREQEEDRENKEKMSELFISDSLKDVLESINNLESKIEDTNCILNNSRKTNRDN